MKKVYHTAIVGGGAAGLMTAVDLLRGKNRLSGDDIVILERLDRVGKKLISTGNGQGNLVNRNFSEEFYYGEKGFIKEFVKNEREIDIEKYLSEFGIPLCYSDEGKGYPLSKQASSVLDIIRNFLIKNGVEERTLFQATEITPRANLFEINSPSGKVLAENVVVAVGGAAAKQFGTDGTSYKLLTDLGHKITKIYPSLVQLKTDLTAIRGLKGLKEVAKVTAIKDGKEIRSVEGDLLFTEFGVSGSAIFALSASIVDKEDVILRVEFIPSMDKTEIEQILNERVKKDYFNESDLLVGLINKRVGQAVIKTAKNNTPSELANALKNFTLKVTGNLGFNYAQVTKGGIVTDDVDKNTMESKLYKNLYIVGEALNVDGDCGGYNLTFAFTSGILASRAIKEIKRGN